MSVVVPLRPRLSSRWLALEAWVGTRGSALALFAAALAVYALQSVALPLGPGRDMGRYVQAFLQLAHHDPVLPAVVNERGPLAALGVGVPLELGGWVAEAWLAALYAASIVAWAAVARAFGARAALLVSGLLLVYPGYGILFHGLSSDALFAAAFSGWALLVTRAVLHPSRAGFLAAGLGMGLLVLVRPGNQALVLVALLPLVLRAPWARRLERAAAFFVGSVAVTQGWRAVADLSHGDGVSLTPSPAALGAAAVLGAALLPGAWRRRALLVAVPAVVAVAAVAAIQGRVPGPVELVRSASGSPTSGVFLFRVFEIDRIVSPDNGPASSELARVVQRDLLAAEPYRSYGVDLDTFFTAGSDRLFQDLVRLDGVDLEAVAREAIRRHPRAFASGIVESAWDLLVTQHVFADVPSDGGAAGVAPVDPAPGVASDALPTPTEGQPIPGSRFGPVIGTLYGDAGEVWTSGTERSFVFDDPRDERRFETLERDTARLSERIPTRDAKAELVRRLNQASKAFPPPGAWLAVGLLALAVRRPRRSLVALVPAAAALALVAATALVAFPVAHYVAPVSPAFVLLAAVGVVGAQPRGRLRLPPRARARPGA